MCFLRCFTVDLVRFGLPSQLLSATRFSILLSEKSGQQQTVVSFVVEYGVVEKRGGIFTGGENRIYGIGIHSTFPEEVRLDSSALAAVPYGFVTLLCSFFFIVGVGRADDKFSFRVMVGCGFRRGPTRAVMVSFLDLSMHLS